MNRVLNVLLVGCGKMGSAMAQRWTQTKACSLTIISPSPRPQFQEHASIYQDIKELPNPNSIDMVVFAVKPQIIGTVISAYEFLSKKSLFLTVAAGKTLSFYREILGPTAPILRLMPNLPVSLGCGTILAIANDLVSSDHKKQAAHLLSSLGETIWLPQESLFHISTAIAGSGPAYLFLMAECLAQAGVSSGLSPEISLKLTKHMLKGSSELLMAENQDPSTLCQNVASPGGVTEAALSVLKPAFSSLFEDALKSAVKRSEELTQ